MTIVSYLRGAVEALPAKAPSARGLSRRSRDWGSGRIDDCIAKKAIRFSKFVRFAPSVAFGDSSLAEGASL